MLGLFEKKKQVALSAEPTNTLLPPQKIRGGPRAEVLVIPETVSDPEFAQEYERVSIKLGTRAKYVRLIESLGLRRVLSEELIPVYSNPEVEAFMDKKGYWGWFPVRAEHSRLAGLVHRESLKNHPSLYGDGKTGQYTEPIPLPVLLTAERIIDRCGDSVSFWVAAIDGNPDPFLGVMFNNDPAHKMYIVERWDEPGFRS